MGAHMVKTVDEVIFTGCDESMLVTLSSGRTIELFGDGFVQEMVRCGGDDHSGSACACKIVEIYL